MSSTQYQHESREVVDLIEQFGAPTSADYDLIEVRIANYKKHAEGLEPNRQYAKKFEFRGRPHHEAALRRGEDGSLSFYIGTGSRVKCIRITDIDGETVFEYAGTNECKLDHRAIMERSNTILRQGVLIVEVWVKDIWSGILDNFNDPLIPQNTASESILALLSSSEESGDISFELKGPCNYRYSDDDSLINKRNIHALFGQAEAVEDDATNTSVIVYAHITILRACAPFLAELCTGYGKANPVPIQNVEPGIFRLMLRHIYGGSVPPSLLSARPHAFIDVADRYCIKTLKVEAEAYYVKTPGLITGDNFVDSYAYAKSRNCDLLQEKVINFILKSDEQIMESPTFEYADLYTRVACMNDEVLRNAVELLFIANSEQIMESRSGVKIAKWPALAHRLLSLLAAQVGKVSFADPNKGLRLDKLRRRLHEEGLDVEGSRETLIERLDTMVPDWKDTM